MMSSPRPTRRRVAILVTHPIQYQAPWFRALASSPRLDIEVFFCHDARPGEQAGAGFDVPFTWDRPLLEGYPHRFLENTARRPSIATFNGLNTPEIGKVIRAGQFDALLVNGWNYRSAWQAFIAARRAGIPVMVRGDSQIHSPRHPAKRLAKEIIYRQFIPRFAACLSVGSRSREYFLHYGARPDRIFLVPHTVDEEFFTAERDRLRPHRDELRRCWDLSASAIVFLFVGKFIPKKRPLDFVQAIAGLARRGVPVAGLMVGDGPLRPDIESLITATAAPVHLAGFLNQSVIPRAYAASDVLVLPSDGGETWGLVVNEAMLSGLPAVVSNAVGCSPDLIAPGAGATFPLGNVDALIERLSAYTDDDQRLCSESNTLRLVASRWSISSAVAGLTDAIDSVTAHAN